MTKHIFIEIDLEIDSTGVEVNAVFDAVRDALPPGSKVVREVYENDGD